MRGILEQEWSVSLDDFTEYLDPSVGWQIVIRSDLSRPKLARKFGVATRRITEWLEDSHLIILPAAWLMMV